MQRERERERHTLSDTKRERGIAFSQSIFCQTDQETVLRRGKTKKKKSFLFVFVYYGRKEKKEVDFITRKTLCCFIFLVTTRRRKGEE